MSSRAKERESKGKCKQMGKERATYLSESRRVADSVPESVVVDDRSTATGTKKSWLSPWGLGRRIETKSRAHIS